MLRGVEADIYNGDHKIMFYFDCTYIIKIAGVIIIRSEGCFSYYYIWENITGGKNERAGQHNL